MSREPSTEQNNDQDTAKQRREHILTIGSFVVGVATLIVALMLAPTQVLPFLETAGLMEPLNPTPTPTATVAPSATPTPTPTPLAFPPAAENETLIIVLTFARGEGVTQVDFHNEIERTINSDVDELNLSDIRVEVKPDVIQAVKFPDQLQAARQVAEAYNASLVIWGQYHGARVDVHFLNLQKPYSETGRVSITETEYTQLADPEAYSQFAIHSLPAQVSFLSLYAIGQLIGRNNPAEATRLIQEAIDNLPADPSETLAKARATAHFHLGWLYQTNRKNDKAIAHYSRAISIKAPEFDYAPVFNNRGLALYDMRRYEQAIKSFDKAIELNPEYDEAYCNRAISHYRLATRGHFEQAFADLEKAIALNGQNARAYFYLGFIHDRLGQFAQSVTNYDKALQLNETARVYFYRGFAYYRHGGQEEQQNAINDFTRAIEINPEYTNAYYYRAAAYDDVGKYDEATEDYKRCLELGPDRAMRKAIQQRLGEPDKNSRGTESDRIS